MHERRQSEPLPYRSFFDLFFLDKHHEQRAGELVSKGDEKAFENKVKACRFLLSVMGILSRSYGILHTLLPSSLFFVYVCLTAGYRC